MSGNATNIPTRRVSNQEHGETLAEVREFLSGLNVRHRPTTWLTGKESHGDIDIVVAEDDWNDIQYPDGVLGHHSRNGFTHVAWPVKNGEGHVQVDFIRTPAQHIEQTRAYLSHGTLGNVLGLVCRSIGLRYGMQGLYMIVRHEDGQKCGNIELESNPQRIFEILQLPETDAARVLFGSFKDREDYYPVPTHLPFFNRECIHPERMTAPNRGRDKKRPEILPYREWLLVNHPGNDWDLPDRDDTAAYLAYQAGWIRRLVGEEKFAELKEKEKEISQGLQKKTGPKGERGEWFATIAKISGMSGQETAMAVSKISKNKGKSIDEISKTYKPQEIWKLIQKNHDPSPPLP